jgi:hypothetical protein
MSISSPYILLGGADAEPQNCSTSLNLISSSQAQIYGNFTSDMQPGLRKQVWREFFEICARETGNVYTWSLREIAQIRATVRRFSRNSLAIFALGQPSAYTT